MMVKSFIFKVLHQGHLAELETDGHFTDITFFRKVTGAMSVC